MKSYADLPARLLKATSLRGASPSAAPFDASALTETIQRALSAAGLNTQAGPMRGVTDTIHQALSAAGLMQRIAPIAHGATFDGVARQIDASPDVTDSTPTEPIAPAKPARPGEFVSRSFTNSAGTRTYKLYVPESYSAEPHDAVPLLVMLHGCTQSPDDFAVGTRMNELAEQYGFLVAYPAQAVDANGARCWNWFRSEDQSRDVGEPALIAGITREVASSYRVDERRIFVAGMSAGAAMAVVLGATYPDLYAAVGAHSGLAYRAAYDMASAVGAMHGGDVPKTLDPRQSKNAVPTIVFHGDRDYTVNARNGGAIVAQTIAGRLDQPNLRTSVNKGIAPGGGTFTHTVVADAADQPVVEQWVLHGVGHAWSGGSPNGSFTNADGPDASAEMIRFFYSQLRAGTA